MMYVPDWISLYWFKFNTLQSFHWENPFFLFAIPLTILIPFIRWALNVRHRQKLEIGTPIYKKDLHYYLSFFRFFPSLFYLLFLSLSLLALARPQVVNIEEKRKIKGLDLLFVLDISESMLLEDFSPNRLSVAKNIISDFVKNRDQDKIGLVVFSGNAYTLAPLTTDYELIQETIKNIGFSYLDTGSSAIGNALGVAINRLKYSNSKTKIIILLSDGDNTSGNLSPETSAYLAKKYQIKIFTVGVGKNGEVPYGKDETGAKRWVSSTLNEKLLKDISKISGGYFFKASDKESLKTCFLKINKLAKNAFTLDTSSDVDDYYYVYLYWGLVCLLIWIALKSSFMNNFLED